MKSNEFKLDEAGGIGIDPWKALGSYLGKTINGPAKPGVDPNQQKNFINNFVQQVTRDFQIHPNLTLNEFLSMYWRKNQWDVRKIAPAYKASLAKSVSDAENDRLSTGSLEKLGNVVYHIALMMPPASSQTRMQSGPQVAVAPVQAPTIETDTNQIISKIRNMNNTSQEIDDLLSIAAVTLIKLRVIAPKQYNNAIAGLFNNGGNPSVAAATSAIQQSTSRPKKPAAEKNMMAAGGRLDPNDPNDANLLRAIQNAQAQGK